MKLHVSHTLPFFLWIAVIFVVQALPSEISLTAAQNATIYAIKSVIVLGLILFLKPWRLYNNTLSLGELALGLAGGIIVVALWIIPEMPNVVGHNFCNIYNKFLIFPLGDFPDYYPTLSQNHPSMSYSPERCGALLTYARLAGSALVIPAAEEYFFRGFLYRWLESCNFEKVNLKKFYSRSFWIVAIVFGLQHDRFFAGALAGVIYGYIAVKTGKLLPSIIAHSLTNLLLGIFVLHSNMYGFW